MRGRHDDGETAGEPVPPIGAEPAECSQGLPVFANYPRHHWRPVPSPAKVYLRVRSGALT